MHLFGIPENVNPRTCSAGDGIPILDCVSVFIQLDHTVTAARFLDDVVKCAFPFIFRREDQILLILHLCPGLVLAAPTLELYRDRRRDIVLIIPGPDLLYAKPHLHLRIAQGKGYHIILRVIGDGLIGHNDFGIVLPVHIEFCSRGVDRLISGSVIEYLYAIQVVFRQLRNGLKAGRPVVDLSQVAIITDFFPTARLAVIALQHGVNEVRLVGHIIIPLNLQGRGNFPQAVGDDGMLRILFIHGIGDIIQGAAGYAANCHIKPGRRIFVPFNTVPLRILFHDAKGGRIVHIQPHALEASGPVFRCQLDVIAVIPVFPDPLRVHIPLYSCLNRAVFHPDTLIIPDNLRAQGGLTQICGRDDRIPINHPEGDGIALGQIIKTDSFRFRLINSIGSDNDICRLIPIERLRRNRYIIPPRCPLLIAAQLTIVALFKADAVGGYKYHADLQVCSRHAEPAIAVFVTRNARSIRPFCVFVFSGHNTVIPAGRIFLPRLSFYVYFITNAGPVCLLSVLHNGNLSLCAVRFCEEAVSDLLCGNPDPYFSGFIQRKGISFPVFCSFFRSIAIHAPLYTGDPISRLRFRQNPDGFTLFCTVCRFPIHRKTDTLKAF